MEGLEYPLEFVVGQARGLRDAGECYGQSVANLARVALGNDTVSSDNTATQIAAMTPAFNGSVTAGYTATATIGIAR